MFVKVSFLLSCSRSIKPTLKKVSKYENKFAKLQKKAAEFNFRNQLKTVKKKEFELEDDKGNVVGVLHGFCYAFSHITMVVSSFSSFNHMTDSSNIQWACREEAVTDLS